MRTFPSKSALMRGFLSSAMLLGAVGAANAQASEAGRLPPTRTGTIPALSAKPGTFYELRSDLSENDRQVALRALHIALNQLSDGAAFVWRSKARKLTGVIRPTIAFRDDDGRVCRHVVYTVALGRYQKRIEGIAWRSLNGSWMLTN